MVILIYTTADRSKGWFVYYSKTVLLLHWSDGCPLRNYTEKRVTVGLGLSLKNRKLPRLGWWIPAGFPTRVLLYQGNKERLTEVRSPQWAVGGHNWNWKVGRSEHYFTD